ncbi:MAG TPA: class I SAM-dependent methyltransferase [Candidatus Acidoferrum sp.]|nr:class I SAM-dependent methyltransferase [Candidatus Acidoferrum sp.]
MAQTGRAKAYKGMGMEGLVAKWYARITRNDLSEFKALARRAAQELAEGARVLEVAPGPGYFAIELAKLGKYKITGLDISETFVQIARENAREEGVDIDFRRGNVSRMPLNDHSFDWVVCRAAFKNFADPIGALREIYRILTTGGKAVIIDLRKDAPKQEIDAHVDRMKVGQLNSILVKWAFRGMLLRRAYTKQDFERLIGESGFQKSKIADAPVGFEITLTK